MMTERFNRLFLRLVTAFERYQDTSRSPDDVATLAARRYALDIQRELIARERIVVVGTSVPPRSASRTSVSEEDLARLRVFATGSTGS